MEIVVLRLTLDQAWDQELILNAIGHWLVWNGAILLGLGGANTSLTPFAD